MALNGSFHTSSAWVEEVQYFGCDINLNIQISDSYSQCSHEGKQAVKISFGDVGLSTWGATSAGQVVTLQKAALNCHFETVYIPSTGFGSKHACSYIFLLLSLMILSLFPPMVHNPSQRSSPLKKINKTQTKNLHAGGLDVFL